ncbi:MAG: hypothetical protein LBC77_09335 [Spirochaetaceae bacterium]|jgi:hypothetical protein|nr:hypothetical protein [Spirochaetaceae bacterium]
MQAIRQIMDAERLYPVMDMPDTMRGMKVEVIVVPAAEQETPPEHADYAALEQLCGSLRQYAKRALISGEKSAWQTAVAEKAAQSKHDG